MGSRDPGASQPELDGAVQPTLGDSESSSEAPSTESKGGDLFIVDNSHSGWTGLRYLEEWTEIAQAFDIATGYFEIGALLALDGKWQGLDKLRILLGAETTVRTGRLLLEAVTGEATERLDESLEEAKAKNPFLEGVPGILEALKSGQIECKVYDKAKFHAKAYITHGRLDVVGSRALVGSSNFTRPGLTDNVELNIQIASSAEVKQLQKWFEDHWKQASEVTPDVIETIARHTQEFTPFDIYAKALQEFFRGHELTATEWDETESTIFHELDRYQQEAYWGLMKIARQHGGAFLCDGVGLGKTFVALMLIERLVMHEGKRVVLLAPKAVKEGVWDPHLREWLPNIGGTGGGGDFSNLAVFSHTDLGRKGDFPERFARIAELADVVVIDEAHHFRNPGRKGDEEKGIEPSRYYRLYDLLDKALRPKTLYMLTATPINNRLSDFRHMVELFSRRDEAYFARTLGINNMRAHFNNMEKALREAIDVDVADMPEHVSEAEEVLAADETFRQLVIQRSRSYAKASQIQETGEAAAFPERLPPKVADYSIRKSYGHLLDIFEEAFRKSDPLFRLAIYYPLHWLNPDNEEGIDPLDEGRQRQVVSLIRTQFLKRFESSVAAFELSCDRLLRKLLAFVEVHSESESEKERLARWKAQNAEILGAVRQRQLDLWGEEDEEALDEDVIPDEFLEAVDYLDREQYRVEEMIAETFLDLDQLVKFLTETRRFEARHDDKLKKLIRLLKSKDLADQKVIVFTEFADTARYLRAELEQAGIEQIEQVDSGTKRDRADVIKRFSPYYNGSSSPDIAEGDRPEIKVLISTDVLSEGLNLQDASRMINYDIHWNPVRLMQRIGRVDRRMNPVVEERMASDHPSLASTRGKVAFWNFLPPAELNEILSLYKTVTRKTLLISETLGIEGKLLRPDDEFAPLREFNQAYEGTKTAVEEMHLEFQALVQADPNLESRLERFPRAAFSTRKRVAKGVRGVFFCYALPALDSETNEFTEAAGTTRWYFYDRDRDTILDQPDQIIESIRSKPSTPRATTGDKQALVEIRAEIEKHIKNSYLKRLDAPMGVGPGLRCWMELNED